MTLLKEFELSFPGDKEQRRLFQLQTRCVTALYARLFPRFKTERCWKVLIECVRIVSREQYVNLLGVYALEVEADVDNFFSLSDAEKRAWALETLQAGIQRLLEQTGWSAEPFLETYKKAQDLQLVNTWIWKKPVASPSRRLTAEVLVEHNVDSCDISVVVRNRDREEIARKLLISEQPHEWAYARHLGRLKWASEKRIVLVNKEGAEALRFDLRRRWRISRRIQ